MDELFRSPAQLESKMFPTILSSFIALAAIGNVLAASAKGTIVARDQPFRVNIGTNATGSVAWVSGEDSPT